MVGIKPPVRVCVIGDEGVGKTSLITAAATESFPDSPPPTLPTTKLPPDSTPEGVPVQIFDTCSRPEERPALEMSCLNADVIVLLFATDRPQTLSRVSSYWMPELRRLQVTVPVVLVGTKSDLKPNEQQLQQLVVPVMNEFKEIETCLECSAKKLIFVSEVFYYALKWEVLAYCKIKRAADMLMLSSQAVLHPTAPLFSPQHQTLKPLCVAALKRIFLMCDKDKDGALNDDELNRFQVKCFNAPLQPEELLGVKKVVQDKMPSGVNAVGLTLPGFLFLHALFIERGRLETTWAVLRKFGYDNDLLLSGEVLDQVNLQHGADQVVELTPTAAAFLRNAFSTADRDLDGVLSPSEQDELFSTAPSNPWADSEFEGVMVESRSGGLTVNGFLAKWAVMAAAAPRKTLAHLLYLGYEEDPSALFHIARPRRQERKADQPARGVYQCLVFGAVGVGKSTLLAGLAGQQSPSGTPGAAGGGAGRQSQPTAAGRVDIGDGSALLIMREWDEGDAAALLESPAVADTLVAADVAAFVFDGSDAHSLRTAQRLLLRIATAAGDSLPCVLVATKDDAGMSRDVITESSEVAAALALREPVCVSVRTGETAGVYAQLVEAAMAPERFIPLTPTLEAARNYRRTLRRILLYTTAATAVGGAVYFGYRFFESQQASAEASASEHKQPPAAIADH